MRGRGRRNMDYATGPGEDRGRSAGTAAGQDLAELNKLSDYKGKMR